MTGSAVAQNLPAQSDFDRTVTPQLTLPQLNNLDLRGRVGQSATGQTVYFEATLEEGGEPIENGLIWRVFDPTPNEDGKFTLISTAQGGSTNIDFEPGDYFVHVAFGRAGATKRLVITETEFQPTQRFVLDAGGIILQATAGTTYPIDPDDLSFSIYSGEDENANDNERPLVLEQVPPDVIVRLSEGVYHIVSNYGDINSQTRANMRVEKGKLTQVQMQHRAAKISFKLVSREGGEAIADTAWSLYSASGDFIKEGDGAFPSLILAEGDYSAVALHQNREYSQDFKVVAGQSVAVEVLLTQD